MKKVDCKKVFKDVTGKEITAVLLDNTPEVVSVGKAVAFLLTNKRNQIIFNNNHIKIFEMGQRFYKNDTVELDDADYEDLVKAFKECTVLNSIILANLLIAFKDAEEVKAVK
jgi:hypothetical protein